MKNKLSLEGLSGFKVLFDALIPGLANLLHLIGVKNAVSYWDFIEFDPVDLQDVDMVFIRSTTKVSQALLDAMPVLQVVATATSGTDHIDQAQLKAREIYCIDAKGSNANAVATYVVMALNATGYFKDPKPGRQVVVGRGHVGLKVRHQLLNRGLAPQWADPHIDGGLELIPMSSECSQWRDVESWLNDTQLLCLHTPLVKDGPWATVGWLNEQRLSALPDGAFVVCAGRGETLDQTALLNHADRLNLVLDVWPFEPMISKDLALKARIATPHIAGHSKLGKILGTWQIFEQLCRYLHVQTPTQWQQFLESQLENQPHLVSVPSEQLRSVGDKASSFDLVAVSDEMKSNLDMLCSDPLGVRFKQFRKQYSQHPEIIF